MSTTEATSSSPETRTLRVFLTRGVIAIAWAAVFTAVSDSLTLAVGILLVLYPLIDVVATLLDALTQQESARRLLLANGAVSAIVAIALGVAATGSIANVFTVFGAWAFVCGAALLATAIRRRVLLGKQWPMRLAGAGSIIIGLAYLVGSTTAEPKLSMLALYAFTGGVDFIIEAWLLGRRRRRVVNVPRRDTTLVPQS
jgi:uncharacterized membrane protein HdeD (DUF308 family)